MTANAKNGVSGTMSYSVAGKRVIAQGTLTVNNAVEPYTDIVSGLPVVYGNNTYTVVSSSVNADAFFIKENGTITSRYALTQGGTIRLSCSYLTN